MVFAVLERNHIAILRFSKDLQHFAGKYPVVTTQNSRARFDDDACHGNSTTSFAQELGFILNIASSEFSNIFEKLAGTVEGIVSVCLSTTTYRTFASRKKPS